MIETEEILHVVERKNPREYLMQIFKAWKWFAFSFIVCLIIGLGFLRYSTSIYSSEATILIVEDEENALLIRDAIDHKDKYSLARKTESESIILKSRFLLQRVVKSQRLNIQIFSLTGRTGLKSTESYQNPAFTISQAEDSDSILYNEQMEFIIHPVNSTSYELTIGNTSPRLLQINDTFTIDSIDLKLNTTSNYEEHWMDYKYKVVITPVDQVVTTLQKKIIINDEKSEVGVLVISLNGPTPLKNDDIINGLIQQYQTNNIFEKNKVSSNTNKFLSERISLIEKELSMIESSGESLKKQNDVLDVDIQYSNILLKQSDLENKILNTEVQLAVIQYVEEYVNEEGNKLVPVNLGLVSTPLVKSISAYNTLYAEYIQLKETTGSKNPNLFNIENELTSSKLNLQKSMGSLILSQEIRLKELKTQYEVGQQKIDLLPRFETQQRNIDRHKQIVETLYLFLLQKKEENEIILAATIADCRVIDKAFSNPSSILPNKRIVYVLILILSLALPLIGLYLKAILNIKVRTTGDFDKYKIPLFGTIATTKEKQSGYSKYLNNPTSESFRILRVHLNLLFDTTPDLCKTVLVTSLNSNEGKTFTAINLARSLADIGKAVLVIDFDLHQQGLTDQLELKEDSKGVSNYLMEEKAQLNDLIIPSTEFDSLSFITSGNTPPNPSELLSSMRVQNLINEAKATFDYVIIDSRSIEETIDTYLLVKHVDMTMLVCRSGQLKTEELKTIRSHTSAGKLGNIQVIFNHYQKTFIPVYRKLIRFKYNS